MDIADLEQRLTAIEDSLLQHPDVLRQLPRPSLTWMKILSGAMVTISVFLLIAGTVSAPYAAVFLGVAAALTPLEKLLDIYLTSTTAQAAATRATAAATVVAVRHQAALATLPVVLEAPCVPMPPPPPR